MKRIIVEHEGILHRNPRPGHRAESAFLPNVVVLDDGQLLCVYRVGQAFYSTDGKLAKVRSADNGLTWDPDGVVWDPRQEAGAYEYSAPHLTRLGNGTLLMIANRRDASNDEETVHSQETGGVQESDIVLFRSTDNGESWSKPQMLELPGDRLVDAPSQIIELNSGRLFLACEVWKAWDDPKPLHIKGFAMFSDDGGRTWDDRLDFPSAAETEKMYSHTRYTKMLDGRVCGLQMTKTMDWRFLDIHFTVSDQTATQWAYPQPTGLPGQTSWAADLGDGIIAGAYTRREGPEPGILVALSEDEGATWDMEQQVLAWDAVGQEFLGTQHPPTGPASHDNIAFGKPNLTRLPDGSLLAAWWCTQACVTHCRFAKLRVCAIQS